MKVLLYILRSNLEILGVVDTFISLIWKTALTKAGNFELYVPATPTYRRLLLANRFIARSDAESFMYITSVQEKVEDDGTKIILSGYSAEGIFRKRLYPELMGHEWKQKEGPINITEVVEAINPLGFNCNFDILNASGTPINDVPSSYLSGDMENYFRYILGRTQTELKDENGEEIKWFKLIPQSYRLYINEDTWYSGLNNQIEAIFDVVPVYGELIYDQTTPDGETLYKPYMPYPPTCMFSDDIGNISGLQYTYSEEDCYSAVLAVINPDFSKTVTEKQTKIDSQTGESYEEEVTRNIGLEDVDITTDEQKKPILPSVWSSVADDYLGQTENIIYVDPEVVPWTRPEGFIPWKEYVGKAMKNDTYLGTALYESDGRAVQRHSRYQTQGRYQIDGQATIRKMRTEINKILLKGTENYQGTIQLSYDEFRNYHGHGSMFHLGDIIVIRDNNRMKDYYKRVEEIEETFDRNGYKVVPTLGEPLKSIWDKIQGG